MTATVAQPLKSILFTSRCPSRYDDEDGCDASAGALGGGLTLKPTRPVLITGKLKNLRNYYARRRPALKPPSSSSCRQPTWIVSSEQEDDNDSLSSSSSSLSSSGVATTKGVRFHSEVTIHEIPSRKEYTKADKRAIWTPRQELKKLILKNHTEFTFEGRDWRNAPEEEEFGRDEHGELVHPVHLALKQRKRSPQQVLLLDAAKKRKSCSEVATTNASTTNKRLCLRKLPLSNSSSDPAVIEADEDVSES
ncbi:hypothetical protein ACA910_001250 [Epithemia clementina (nom. ined.)]